MKIVKSNFLSDDEDRHLSFLSSFVFVPRLACLQCVHTEQEDGCGRELFV